MLRCSMVDLMQPACRVYFPLHPARYEPVSTYLEPHSRRTHVPLVRHPPSLDIKANRNAGNQTNATCVQGVLPTTPCQIWACVYLFGTPLQEDTRASRASGLGTSSQVTVYEKRCKNLANAVPTLWQRRWYLPSIEAAMSPCHLRNVICTAYHRIIECVQLDYTVKYCHLRLQIK